MSAPDKLLLNHSHWLGVDWLTDAHQTLGLIKGELLIDWLIVDHYALDARWESVLRPFCRHIMVIDDLADRSHDCDLLLDQNLGRDPKDYECLVSADCKIFTSPRYALLRHEFASYRNFSLQRRTHYSFNKLLITMGGVDSENATYKILEALKTCILPKFFKITVIMGRHAPWLSQVRKLASVMPRPTKILVDVSNMAQLMSESDFSIGAAGSTSWERCCLGLPAIVLILGQNQVDGAKALQNANCIVALTDLEQINRDLAAAISSISVPSVLDSMIAASSKITDGQGARRLVNELINLSKLEV